MAGNSTLPPSILRALPFTNAPATFFRADPTMRPKVGREMFIRVAA